MPQFIRNGPDIPERLLQAHEDGRVVFFCGAGISYPAKLPGFGKLVDKLYSVLRNPPNAVQKDGVKAWQYDTAIGLLEAEIVGGREAVRRKLSHILTPDLSAPNSTATHEALLTLGKNRKGRTRIITTNFDRLFEEVSSRESLKISRYQAPLLPVPKNRWEGLVYLHGLLTPDPTEDDLDKLILSSGDFGIAYLTDRWAARFATDLFRNFTVCFVGYSINDPVLRYMMDALAADRLLGESSPEMFAFGSYSKGKEIERANEWRAKNVTPILYREHKHHAYLHRTLHEWAKTYKDGIRGKERIVVECAVARPLGGTRQDEFVDRLLWALSDPSGLPAKHFAEMNPVPSLDWLESLSEKQYRHADLARFGVPPKELVDKDLLFSLTQRPAPYTEAPWMTLVDTGSRGGAWDNVMRQLARWLLRHLDDPVLLLWLVARGGQLHDEFVLQVGQYLEDLAKLEFEGNAAKLNRIRQNAPNAIPGPLMRRLWRLLLTGRLESGRHKYNLFSWRERFKRDGLTSSLRFELRGILTPRVSMHEPIHWPFVDAESHAPERIKDLVGWEIVLSSYYVQTFLEGLSHDDRWNAALPDLLSDFTMLLRDLLDLMRELDGADDKIDHSFFHQPSISPHTQNRHIHDWTALIELNRDAWLATAAKSLEQAVLVAESWRQIPYPLFRRLAFFAATKDDVIPTKKALDWLLADDQWWLWSAETRREALRLLITIARSPQLDEVMLGEFERAILTGPPRSMYRTEIEPEIWTQIKDYEIWLRLEKLAQTGVDLSPEGSERLRTLSAQHSDWILSEDQREEFSSWSEGGFVGTRDPWRQFVSVPRTRRGVLNYLRENPVLPDAKQDDWRKRCSESFQATAYALWQLSRQGVWPNDRWRDALQAWSEEKLRILSWKYMAPILSEMPNDLLQSLAHSLSWWLQVISKTFEGHNDHFFSLVRRLLELGYPDRGSDSEDPITRALNHPAGLVTEALLGWWFRFTLDDGQGLPVELKSVFTNLCDVQNEKFWPGRILLAAHVVTLFRVDPEWTIQNLLPLFDWHRSETEALMAWKGFLWSPRLYRPLMDKLKTAFLDTALHYEELGESAGHYASLLTFAALDRGDTFTITELKNATHSLTQSGLEEAAQALVRALEGAGDQRTDYWTNRVKEYLNAIWPRTQGIISHPIAQSFARLGVEAQDAFPDALALLRPWLQPIEHSDFLVRRLHETDLCSRFPEQAVDFLFLVVDQSQEWLPGDLSTCLEIIRANAPELIADPRFEQLWRYFQSRE